jgi:phosphate-selective porin OprO/OprP
VGGAYGTDDSLPNIAANGLTFRSNARGSTFFSNSTAMTNPDIVRYGLEGIASFGPVKFQTEYANMSIEHVTQATGAKNKPDIDAYYAGVSYMITGEKYAESYKNGVMDRMSPKNDYTGLGSSGMGAWEIGVRYSKFGAKDFAIAPGQFVNEASSYSAGLKWIVDPNTRFLLNYINTDFDTRVNGGYSTVASFDSEKAINFRAQFDF